MIQIITFFYRVISFSSIFRSQDKVSYIYTTNMRITILLQKNIVADFKTSLNADFHQRERQCDEFIITV